MGLNIKYYKQVGDTCSPNDISALLALQAELKCASIGAICIAFNHDKNTQLVVRHWLIYDANYEKHPTVVKLKKYRKVP